MSRVIEGVYLGTQTDSQSKKNLEAKKISHILIAGAELDPEFPNDSYTYKHIPLLDTPYFDSKPFLKAAANFILKAKTEGTGILIYDYKGEGRAVSCQMAYFLKNFKLDFSEAWRTILTKVPTAKINMRYKGDLKLWAQKEGKFGKFDCNKKF